MEVRVDDMIGYIEYPKMHADGYAGWPVGIVSRHGRRGNQRQRGRARWPLRHPPRHYRTRES